MDDDNLDVVVTISRTNEGLYLVQVDHRIRLRQGPGRRQVRRQQRSRRLDRHPARWRQPAASTATTPAARLTGRHFVARSGRGRCGTP